MSNQGEKKGVSAIDFFCIGYAPESAGPLINTG